DRQGVLAAPEPASATAAARRTSGLRVRVLNRDTLEPVANLPVRAYDTWPLPSLDVQRAPFVDPDPVARFERLGEVETSDAKGELFLPRPRGALHVLVSANGLHGEAQWRTNSEEPALLYVRPARRLEVSVLDARGEPVVGAPIALRARLASERRLVYEARTCVQADGRTYALVPALDPLFERHDGQEFSVGIGYPSELPVEQALDTERPPAKIELRLPETGAIRVRLLDEQGQPLHVRGLAQVSIDTGRLQGPARARADNLRYGRAFEDGEFVLQPLPLFERFHVRVQCDGYSRQSLPALDGPRGAGQEVLLEYRFQKRLPVLSGRVVDAAGVPQGEREFQGMVFWPQVQRSSGWKLESAVVTDSDGRFHHVASNGVGDGVRELLLVEIGPRRKPAAALAIEAAAAADAGSTSEASADSGDAAVASPDLGAPRRAGRIAIPDLPSGVEIALGDIELVEESARARGSVVDEHGAPIPGAQVWLEQANARRVDADGELQPQNYQVVGDGSVFSDESGAFALYRIDGQGGALSLRAAKEGYLSEGRVPLDPAGTRLVLSSGGALAGRVLLSRDVSRERLEAQLRATFTRPDQDEPREVGLSIEPDGRFRARGLESGAWDFTLRLEGEERPLYEARGLLVEAGATCADERIQAIDLREFVRGYTLTVLGPDGEPVGDGRVVVLALQRGEHARTSSIDLRGGRARVATSGPALDLEVSASGFRPLRVLGLREDRTVRLEAGLLVRLRFARAEPIDPKRRYQYSLDPNFEGVAEDAIPAWAQDGTGGSLDERGEAVAVLPAAGSYHVYIWSYVVRAESRQWEGYDWSSLGPSGPETPWVITVTEAAGEQVFDLRPGDAPRAPEQESGADAGPQKD
ncbi:MAG: carboxypeptidase regulatory-like domain-containing protein, partial [Planctomycetes bacterium]|nr:carboxypeptidase regulatory-like domain-containing protein [Planctomycetota bacterium]